MSFRDKNGDPVLPGDVVLSGGVEYVAEFSEAAGTLVFPRKDGSGWFLRVWTGDEEIFHREPAP